METKLPNSHLLIGLNPGIDKLNTNIAHRTNEMIKTGLVKEAQKVGEKYGFTIEALSTIGYSEALNYIHGNCAAAEVEVLINTHTRQLARRQMTWFKRDKNIHWVESPEQGLELAKEFLSS